MQDQYITVYEALYEAFQYQDTSLTTDEFIKTIGNVETRKIRIEDEFKVSFERWFDGFICRKAVYSQTMYTIGIIITKSVLKSPDVRFDQR